MSLDGASLVRLGGWTEWFFWPVGKEKMDGSNTQNFNKNQLQLWGYVCTHPVFARGVAKTRGRNITPIPKLGPPKLSKNVVIFGSKMLSRGSLAQPPSGIASTVEGGVADRWRRLL